MTHQSSHVIIHKATDPVSFASAEAPPPVPGKLKVWHLGAALLLVGVVVGALLF